MAVTSKKDLEAQLTDSVSRMKKVAETNAAARSAAQQPEPDVSPRNVTVQPARVTGPGSSR